MYACFRYLLAVRNPLSVLSEVDWPSVRRVLLIGALCCAAAQICYALCVALAGSSAKAASAPASPPAVPTTRSPAPAPEVPRGFAVTPASTRSPDEASTSGGAGRTSSGDAASVAMASSKCVRPLAASQL